jgi:hypothetical protein
MTSTFLLFFLSADDILNMCVSENGPMFSILVSQQIPSKDLSQIVDLFVTFDLPIFAAHHLYATFSYYLLDLMLLSTLDYSPFRYIRPWFIPPSVTFAV